jgi:chromosome segregation ATPase
MPKVEVIDFETGLPLEVAKRLREKLEKYEEKIASLEAEKKLLQDRLSQYEGQINQLMKTLDSISLDVQMLKTNSASIDSSKAV